MMEVPRGLITPAPLHAQPATSEHAVDIDLTAEKAVVPMPRVADDDVAEKARGGRGGTLLFLLVLLVAAGGGWVFLNGLPALPFGTTPAPEPVKPPEPAPVAVKPPEPAPPPAPAVENPPAAKKAGKKKRPAPAKPGTLTRDALLKRVFFLEKRVGLVMATGQEIDGDALLAKLSEARTGARMAITDDERMAVAAELDDIEMELSSPEPAPQPP
jgi:hypothetical protein